MNWEEFEQCPICGEFDFVSRHRCPPAWYVRIVEDDDRYAEPMRVYARDTEEAAEKFGENWDSWGDYPLLSGEEIAVLVSPCDQPDDEQGFIVTGEMIPEYRAHATEVTP